MKQILASFVIAALTACGGEVATTAATSAAIKKQELEQGNKTAEQMRKQVEQSAEQAQQRARQAE